MDTQPETAEHVQPPSDMPLDRPCDYLDSLIDEKDAAEFLDWSPRTLQAMRRNRIGPRFYRLNGRNVRYRRRDLLGYAENCAEQVG